MKIKFHRLAEDELEEIDRYFFNVDESRKLVADFRKSFDLALDLIVEDPQRPVLREHKTRIRRVGKFWIKIVYQIVREQDFIFVVSICHMHREPNYWLGRTSET